MKTIRHTDSIYAPAANRTSPMRRGGWCRGVLVNLATHRPAGLSLIETVMALLAVALLVGILTPLLLKAREVARRHQCGEHLRQVGVGLISYHDTHASLMPAAVWTTHAMRSLALHEVKRYDLFTHANWALMLLPYVDHESLANAYDFDLPVAAEANQKIRTTRLDLLACPDDDYNRSDNPFLFQPMPNRTIAFARGNYSINGGTQNFRTGTGNTMAPNIDATHLIMNGQTHEFRFWGNGIAGFNQAFSFDDFTNGQSTLVAVDEVRAGIHSIDPRGAWALGQVASSVTWADGVDSDAYGPNNQWPRSDDFVGCAQLHETLGIDKLAEEEMPCVWYVDINQNATARSRHPSGVNALFVDGHVEFLSNSIDPGLWHVIHSRETPAAMLRDDFDTFLTTANFTEEAEAPECPWEEEGTHAASATDSPDASDAVPIANELSSDGSRPTHVNSIGMTFVTLPAGEFTMGVPDEHNDYDPPPECPAHRVRITHAFQFSTHEVTRAQFETVMGRLPSVTIDPPARKRPGKTTPEERTQPAPDWPVTEVTWYDAAEFCRQLSNRPEERAAKCWYRLPTEAEWEYGCRAGQSDPYPWPSRRQPDDESGEAAGIRPALPLTSVGSYPPNAFGLYDMRGNAWEWTADWFDRDYYARSPANDPRGPAVGFIKVIRGGDWRFIGESCRIDYPMTPPWKSNPFVGFRVVCESQTQVISPGFH